MTSEDTIQTFQGVSDEVLFEETARRLQAQYRKDHGADFRYGTFRFLFHDGRFQGIEDWARHKRYVPGRRAAGPFERT